MVKPADMDAVAVSRGGWKGIGDIEVKGSGFGLVKLIWRHGEQSKKKPELQVSKEDVMDFPRVIRAFLPSRDATAESPGREWRVVRNHPEFGDRVVVYADAMMDGGRHLVSVYIQEPGRAGSDMPLSKQKADTSAESPGKRFEAHTGDTPASFLRQRGQSVSADTTIPKNLNKSMEPATDGDYYRVNTAFPVRQADYPEKHGSMLYGLCRSGANPRPPLPESDLHSRPKLEIHPASPNPTLAATSANPLYPASMK